MKNLIILSILFLCIVPSMAFSGGYGHGIHNNAQQVVVFDKQVIFDEDLYLGYEGYLSVVDELKEAKQGQQEQLIELLKIQLKNNADQTQLLKELIKNKNVVVQTPQNPEDEDEDIVTLPVEQPKNDAATKVLYLFKQKCATCHGVDATNGVELLTADRKLNPNITLRGAVRIYTAVKGGQVAKDNNVKRMPLGKPELSQEEKDIVHNWLESFEG